MQTTSWDNYRCKQPVEIIDMQTTSWDNRCKQPVEIIDANNHLR